MKTLLAALTLATTLVAPAVLAQDHHDEINSTTEYTFEEHHVDGGRYNPEETGINVRRRNRRYTLVQPRQHYIPEMLKSVENL